MTHLQGDVLPDGSEAGEAAQWLARRTAEAELAAAEEAAARGEPVRDLWVGRVGWGRCGAEVGCGGVLGWGLGDRRA